MSAAALAADFAAIDWTAPWFAQWAARGRRWQQAALVGEAALLDAMNADARDARLVAGSGLPLSFVPQRALRADVSYGQHIARTGSVPTRYNLHDFFNGLAWLQFPRIKVTLDALGAAAAGSTDRASADVVGGAIRRVVVSTAASSTDPASAAEVGGAAMGVVGGDAARSNACLVVPVAATSSDPESAAMGVVGDGTADTVHTNAAFAAAAAAIATGEAPRRSRISDALTHFDENAVLFACADPALGAALRGFDWRTLFVASRDAWSTRCEVRCFGHALLEKLMTPFKACTAHAWIVDVPADYFTWPDAARDAWLDAAVSAALKAGALSGSRAFAPLPVLGIPGWWPANADSSFYGDLSVFRPGRRSRPGDARIAASKVGQAVAASAVSAVEGEESPDSDGQGDG